MTVARGHGGRLTAGGGKLGPVYDPPLRWATRGRVMPGTILDTDYRLREEKGAVVVTVTKVATGPMTEEEAAGIARFGDFTSYAPAIRKLAAS